MKRILALLILFGSALHAQTTSGGIILFPNYFIDTGAANAYVGALSMSAYPQKVLFCFIPAHTNTGDSTIQFNSPLAAVHFKKSGTTLLAGNELLAGQPSCFSFDGTYAQLLGGTGSGGGSGNLVSLAADTTAAQTLSKTNDTNVTLAIVNNGSGDHSFNLGWSGLLSQARGGLGNSTGQAQTIAGLLAMVNTPLTTSQDILFRSGSALGRLPISLVSIGDCLGNPTGIWGDMPCGAGTVTNTVAALSAGVVATGNVGNDIETPSQNPTIDGAGNMNVVGNVQANAAGTLAGIMALPCNTQTLPVLPTNAVGFIADASCSGVHLLQPPPGAAAANQFILYGAESGSIAAGAWTTFSSTNLTDASTLTHKMVNINSTGLGAAVLTSTALYTPTVTGMVRVTYTAKVTTPGTSSVLGGSVGFQVLYTDGGDNVAQSATLPATSQAGNAITISTGNTGNTATTISQGTGTFFVKTGVAMTYGFGYTSSGTTMLYELHITVETL